MFKTISKTVQARNQGWQLSNRHPRIKTMFIVVKHNNKLQSFFPPKMSAVCGPETMTHLIINDWQTVRTTV